MRTSFPKRTSFLILLAAAGLLAAGALGAATPPAAQSSRGKDDFMPYVELAPFVVKGKQLTISVHARSKGDRRYAERFSEETVKVVCDSVTGETGKGLVIIGKKGEPHPVFVFRRFLALAREGKLDPAVAARGPELHAMLDHWQAMLGEEQTVDADGQGGVDLEFEKILTALPLPLKGLGAKLYQLAWREDFDEARVGAALQALRPADLEGTLFARFDWVFYLPPRGAFEQAIDSLIADALKEEDAGFVARTLVKSVMLVVKPKIRKAIEAMRHAVLFSTVVRARAGFSEEQVDALTNAYLNALMPDHAEPGPEHDRAVKAIRDLIQSFAPEATGLAAPSAL